MNSRGILKLKKTTRYAPSFSSSVVSEIAFRNPRSSARRKDDIIHVCEHKILQAGHAPPQRCVPSPKRNNALTTSALGTTQHSVGRARLGAHVSRGNRINCSGAGTGRGVGNGGGSRIGNSELAFLLSFVDFEGGVAQGA